VLQFVPDTEFIGIDMQITRKCQYAPCSKNFIADRSNAKFCCIEHRTAHYNRMSKFKFVPEVCQLPECDKPINQGEKIYKPANFCCPAHAMAYSRRHRTATNRVSRKSKYKISICEYKECLEEFTKSRHDQKFCCAEHRILSHKKPVERLDKFRTVCYWTGEFFETTNEKEKFKRKQFKTIFYNAGYKLEDASVEREYTSESYDKDNLSMSVFLHCDFKNTSFESTNFTKCRFLYCTFSDCDFEGAYLLNTYFQDCEFYGDNNFVNNRIRKIVITPENNKVKFKSPIEIKSNRKR